jgi:hypothetical protein
MTNCFWYIIQLSSHVFSLKDGYLLTTYDYQSTIDNIQAFKLSFAASSSGKIFLNYFDSSIKSFVFPDAQSQNNVTSFSLTYFLLILAIDNGLVIVFNTKTQVFLDNYQHPNPILSITPHLGGIHFVFIDSKG